MPRVFSSGLGRKVCRLRFRERRDMGSLSLTERIIADEFCKGLSDKEVADNLNKSYWTVKTQKKSIYRKLGISKDTELLLYMICDKLHKEFDLREIRKHGLEVLFSVLFLVMQITCNSLDDMRMMRVRRGRRTEYVCGNGVGDDDGKR